MNTCVGVDVQMNAFLIFTPRPLYLRGKSSCTHWIGGIVSNIAGLNDVEERKILRLPGLESLPSVFQLFRQR
jgi:hypothetical protein